MAASETRLRGVVIGVDHYRHFGPGGQLAGCVNDAVAIHRFLVDHVGVPAARLELLLAPAPGRHEPAATGPATAAGIRAAFARLVEAGDATEVIVYYAGHGIRIARDATGEYVYGMAPGDASAGGGGFANLVLGRELNQLVQRLLARGVTPTVIADTCHAGGSLRAAGDGRQRRLVPADGSEWRASEEAWPGLGAGAATSGAPVRGCGSGWLDEVTSNDWVMLAACRDTETAGEYERDEVTAHGVVPVPHGKLTGALLDELERVPAHAVASLRWIDLHPGLRRAIERLGTQTPTLEGRPERPVFGGAWVPFQPGFPVEPTARPDLVEVGAGLLHGLDAGAAIAIVPPGTADLAAAMPVARAVVEQASAATSTARITSGGPVAPASRALLTRPSPRTPAIRVVIGPDARAALGAATIDALREAASAAGTVVLVDGGPADGALRPVVERWALVPFAAGDAPTVDDVIAYLPDGTVASAAAGRAIAAGLAHWAAYRRVRDRSSLDPTLRALVEVHLRAGAEPSAEAERCPRQPPDATGTHEVLERQPIWIELATRRVPSSRIFVAVVLCSDDGNTMVLWPPPGGDGALGDHGATEHDLPAGQTVYVGRNRHAPAFPTVRVDQRSSRYTFKVVACTVRGRAPDLSGLALERTVQQVIDGSLGAKDIEVPRPVAPDLWCTWDLAVRVVRRG
jgi:hypothetical protein